MPGAKTSRPTIEPLLVLDDDEAVLEPVTAYLRELGYAVVAAREPEEAEALLAHHRFSLVVLDLNLSPFGPDGLNVLQSIRALHGDLPVVIVSANVRPEVEAEARRMEVNAVLTKPVPLADLARVIADALEPR
jgi:CheY-like chemotaxis protein